MFAKLNELNETINKFVKEAVDQVGKNAVVIARQNGQLLFACRVTDLGKNLIENNLYLAYMSDKYTRTAGVYDDGTIVYRVNFD